MGQAPCLEINNVAICPQAVRRSSERPWGVLHPRGASETPVGAFLGWGKGGCGGKGWWGCFWGAEALSHGSPRAGVWL